MPKLDKQRFSKLSSRKATFWLTLIFPAFFCSASHADALNGKIEPPSLQVEVIIFSQQDFYQAEQPRRDVKLAFESPWRYLKDPNQQEPPQVEPQIPENCVIDENRFEQFSTTPHATTQVIPSLEEELALEDTINNENNPSEPGADEEPGIGERLLPQIEPSYQLLDKSQRQLNPDAYTLNKSPGYRVLYHQAWRQPSHDANKSPWIIVIDGDDYGERHELEGSMRLFLSRYPHFQANIWKSRFIPNIQAPKLSGTPASNPVDTSENQALMKSESWPELPAIPQLELLTPATETCPAGYVLQEPEVELVDTLNAPDASQLVIDEAIKPAFVPDAIWTLNQSVRLEYDKLAYLDHPTMGVLVLVSEYQPETKNTENGQPGSN